MSEFSDGTQICIFIFRNSFTTHINNLLEKEGATIGSETVRSAKIVQTTVDYLQMGWPHMFGSIHTKTGHTQRNQLIQEVDNTILNPGYALIQILQTDQFTIAYLIYIIVVINATAGMEIGRGKGYSRETLRIGISCRTSGTNSSSMSGCHMIEYNIDIGADTNGITTFNHTGKLIFISGTCG
uniref:Uncharacterized protein n=1 Tax=Haematobia irritans TaxID=7368 RepID=A0A1L8E7X4_HAEIR